MTDDNGSLLAEPEAELSLLWLWMDRYVRIMLMGNMADEVERAKDAETSSWQPDKYQVIDTKLHIMGHFWLPQAASLSTHYFSVSSLWHLPINAFLLNRYPEWWGKGAGWRQERMLSACSFVRSIWVPFSLCLNDFPYSGFLLEIDSQNIPGNGEACPQRPYVFPLPGAHFLFAPS